MSDGLQTHNIIAIAALAALKAAWEVGLKDVWANLVRSREKRRKGSHA